MTEALRVVRQGLEFYCEEGISHDEDAKREVDEAFALLTDAVPKGQRACSACGHGMEDHEPDGKCHCGEGKGNRCACRGFEGERAWKVEMKTVSGWDDAGWNLGDLPQRFNTRTDANAAIDEFIEEQHEAVAAGDMDDEYDREDYRAALALGD